MYLGKLLHLILLKATVGRAIATRAAEWGAEGQMHRDLVICRGHKPVGS